MMASIHRRSLRRADVTDPARAHGHRPADTSRPGPAPRARSAPQPATLDQTDRTPPRQPVTPPAPQLLDRALAAASTGITGADVSRPDHPLVWVNPAFAPTPPTTATTSSPPRCATARGSQSMPRQDRAVRAAIAGVAWTTIQYTDAVFDEAQQRWVSDAQVAEVGYTAFTSKPKASRVTARLIVRRVKDKNPDHQSPGSSGAGPSHRGVSLPRNWNNGHEGGSAPMATSRLSHVCHPRLNS